MIDEAYMPVYIVSRFSLRAGPPEVVQEALADLKKKTYNCNLLPYLASLVLDCAAYLNKRSTFYAEKRNSVFYVLFSAFKFLCLLLFSHFLFCKMLLAPPQKLILTSSL